MTLTKKKPKKKNLGSLKKKLWGLVSKYVRVTSSDPEGYCQCVTCGYFAKHTELQAGHFIPKAQGNAIYFDLRNIHPQCYRCNINLGSNGPEYFRYMQNKYGDKVIDELRRLSKTTLKITGSEYEEQIKYYQDLLKNLEQLKKY